MEIRATEKPAVERGPTLKAIQSAVSQREIVLAAMRLIRRQGFHRSSMAQIAAEAGLTKGALYWHFRSKEELGRAVLDDVRREFVDRVLGEARGLDGALDRLDVIVATHLRLMFAGSIHCGVVHAMASEIGSYEHGFAESLRGFIDDWAEVVARLLERGKEQGEVQADVNERSAARALVGAVSGAYMHGRLFDDPEQHEGLIAEVQRFVRRAVAAR